MTKKLSRIKQSQQFEHDVEIHVFFVENAFILNSIYRELVHLPCQKNKLIFREEKVYISLGGTIEISLRIVNSY